MRKMQWTELTATCYKRKMVCKNCPMDYDCKIASKYNKACSKTYGLHPIKFLVLTTYANIGLKGIEVFIEVKDDQRDE